MIDDMTMFEVWGRFVAAEFAILTFVAAVAASCAYYTDRHQKWE